MGKSRSRKGFSEVWAKNAVGNNLGPVTGVTGNKGCSFHLIRSKFLGLISKEAKQENLTLWHIKWQKRISQKTVAKYTLLNTKSATFSAEK